MFLKRKILLIAVFISTAFLLTVLFFFDPMQYGFYPPCIFKKFTGFDCPGCGSLRAIHSMMHGEFARAANYNCLLVIFLPVMIIGIVNFITNRNNLRMALLNKPYLLLALICTFWIIRNIPYFPFSFLNSSL